MGSASFDRPALATVKPALATTPRPGLSEKQRYSRGDPFFP